MRHKIAITVVMLLLLALFNSVTRVAPTSMVSSAELISGDGIKWLITNAGGRGIDTSLQPFCDGSAGMTVDDAYSQVTGTPVDAFDNGAMVWVNDSIVTATAGSFEYDSEKRMATVSGGTIAGLPVTMTYYAAAGRSTIRTVVTLGNSTESFVTPTVSFITNLGSDSATEIPASGGGVTGTSSGDSTFTLADRWLITSNSTEGSSAAITHVLFGPDAPPVQPKTVSTDLSTGIYKCPPGTPPTEGVGEHRGVRADFDLGIQPGQSRSLMFFNDTSPPDCGTTCNEVASSRTSVYNSSDLSADLLSGMTASELLSVSNWRFSFSDFAVIGAGGGGLPEVKVYVFDSSGFNASQLIVPSLMAYDSGFRGGVRVATGDVDGDGVPEIITGAGPPGGPHVKVFKADLPNGLVTESAYAQQHVYDAGFGGGVYVAAGDVDGDGKAEVITSAGESGGPHVKVWDIQVDSPTSGTFVLQKGFYAYRPDFGGGVRLASGNLTGDKNREIVVSPATGSQPVKIYGVATDGTMSQALVLGPESGQINTRDGFFPYGESYAGGIFAGVGNVTGTAFDEMIIGPNGGMATTVKVYSLGTSGTVVPSGLDFEAFPGFGGGVRIGSGDTDSDAFMEILTGAGPPGGPHLKTWNFDGPLATLGFSGHVFDSAFGGGIYVSGWHKGWSTT